MTGEQQDKGWCVLELMGHRKLAGYVSDDAGLLRIDVHLDDPDAGRLSHASTLCGDHGGDLDDSTKSYDECAGRGSTSGCLASAGPIATQWYGQSAIYCITATTKDNCLALTKSHQPQPIGRWELPPAPSTSAPDAELGDANVEWDSESGAADG